MNNYIKIFIVIIVIVLIYYLFNNKNEYYYNLPAQSHKNTKILPAFTLYGNNGSEAAQGIQQLGRAIYNLHDDLDAKINNINNKIDNINKKIK